MQRMLREPNRGTLAGRIKSIISPIDIPRIHQIPALERATHPNLPRTRHGHQDKKRIGNFQLTALLVHKDSGSGGVSDDAYTEDKGDIIMTKITRIDCLRSSGATQPCRKQGSSIRIDCCQPTSLKGSTTRSRGIIWLVLC